MTGEAVTGFRSVQNYLDDLDAALAGLPADHVRELHEQIVAHLDDAIGPDAAPADVDLALARLGAPAEVAAAARQGYPGSSRAPRRPRVRRRRITAILSLAVLAALATGAGGWAWSVLRAPALVPDGALTWYYTRDSAHQHTTSADGYTQSTVPIRSGQPQGIIIQIENFSHQAQTVLGAAQPAFLGSRSFRVTVSDRDTLKIKNLFTARYVPHAVILPGQGRYLRVLWTSGACLRRGHDVIANYLTLRVRVGWVIRTEKIWLMRGWALSGPSQGRCP